jgi:nucleoside 2-deoxyribosyltransferase
MSEGRGSHGVGDAAEAMLRGLGRTRRAPVRVYLAGKIGKNDWRHGLVPGLRGALDVGAVRTVCRTCGGPAGDEDGCRKNHNCLWRAEWGEPRAPEWETGGVRLAYAGPYFISCDHGCYHGRSEHGAGAEPGENPYAPDSNGCGGGGASRGYVVARCLEWLRRADAVFGWLDDGSAYGTVAELGYAAALGTPIYLGLPGAGARWDERLDDLWFAAALATETWRTQTAADAFGRFVAHVAQRPPARVQQPAAKAREAKGAPWRWQTPI